MTFIKFLFLSVLFLNFSCTGDSQNTKCKTNSDCPTSRYECNTELGICVSQTNALGNTDVEDILDSDSQ